MHSIVVAAAVLLLAGPPPPGARVVLPASGNVVEGLPPVARWRAEGTVLVGERELVAIDRLLATDAHDRRLVTIEIRRVPCPTVAPDRVTPWPTLGYAAVRAPLPERRAVSSCKAPNLLLELRFPSDIEPDDESLLAEADRWEGAVAAAHAAFGVTRVDLAGAIAGRDRLAFEGRDGADVDLAAPLTLKDGAVIERPGDGLPWLARGLGGHDVIRLAAPTAAALAVQVVPFRRASCEQALDAAVKHLAAPVGGSPAPPVGWQAARAIGADGVALCVAHRQGGIVALGTARVDRELWLPIAAPLLASLAASVAR